MKAKILYLLNFLWSCFISFTFPICFGLIYLNITGHAKGYNYDLGGEKDVSVLLGFIELIIWLAIALPSSIYIFLKLRKKDKKYLFLLIALYFLLAVLCVCFMGGFAAYVKSVFNIG